MGTGEWFLGGGGAQWQHYRKVISSADENYISSVSNFTEHRQVGDSWSDRWLFFFFFFFFPKAVIVQTSSLCSQAIFKAQADQRTVSHQRTGPTHPHTNRDAGFFTFKWYGVNKRAFSVRQNIWDKDETWTSTHETMR